MNGVQRSSGEPARKRTADRHAMLRDALLDAAERAVEREGLARSARSIRCFPISTLLFWA
jgi:hypothetical protein